MKHFEDLWREAMPALHRLANRLAGQREDAEDLLADTALRSLTSLKDRDLESCIRESTFIAWTTRVMQRVWIDTLKSRSRRCPTVSLASLDSETVADPPDPRSNLATAYETLERARRQLSQMSESDLRLVRSILDGSEPAEIACAHGVNPSAMRSRIYRARVRARKAVLN